MGQSNFQKVQSSIVNLIEIQEVDKNKAELFLKDYISSGEKIKDINYFIETQSIDLFLKYFIKCTYRQKVEEEKRTQNIHKSKIEIQEVGLAEKIVQLGCAEIKQKTKFLLNDLKNIYFSANSEIVTIRERIKDIIVSHLGVESYRYYCYKKNKLKETNSKILYLYQSSHSKQIQKYMDEKLEIRKEKQKENENQNEQKLPLILKQLYPYSQHYYFEELEDDKLHLIIFEVFPDKWKYGKCLSQPKIRKILNNIFMYMCQNMQIIYDSDHKTSEMVYKNFFSTFTLLAIQKIIILQAFRISHLIKSLKSIQQKQMQKYLNQIQEYKQKITSKIRYWKKQTQTKQKKLFLNYNYGSKKIQYFYTNDQKSIIFDDRNCHIQYLDEAFSYLFPENKKFMKKINKAIQQNIQNTTIKLTSNCQVVIHIHKNFYFNPQIKQEYSISLLFISEKSQWNNKEPILEKQKLLIKRLKNQNPMISSAGWFRCFLKESNQNFTNFPLSQKRKNNLKLPKLNKQFRISNYKALYSIQDLNEQINIDDQKLNVLSFSSAKLQVFAIKLFSKLEYFRTLLHEGDQFPNFLREIHFNYETNDNPFHNFAHAINVMHTCYLFTKAKKNNNLISNFDKFTIIFSGLCHDVGHTGFTNLFEIARQSPIAILYNNNSPLQNYHASKTFEILRKKQNNFLTSLNQREFKHFRQLIISNILFTDIKEHFTLMKRFEGCKNLISNDDIKLLAGMIVHASDFGGSVKTFQVCKTWSLLVNQQFSKQYQLEGSLELPQTIFMKDLNNSLVLAKNQKGFLKVIVHPLYRELCQYYQDQIVLNNLLKNVQNNISEWEKLSEPKEPQK